MSQSVYLCDLHYKCREKRVPCLLAQTTIWEIMRQNIPSLVRQIQDCARQRLFVSQWRLPLRRNRQMLSPSWDPRFVGKGDIPQWGHAKFPFALLLKSSSSSSVSSSWSLILVILYDRCYTCCYCVIVWAQIEPPTMCLISHMLPLSYQQGFVVAS